MPQAKISDTIEIEYDTFGKPSDPALLLVMGFTAQMTLWDEAFCRLLADGGRFVIRFDNRDVGLSTKLDGQAVDMNAILGALFGDGSAEMPPVPYTLSDFERRLRCARRAGYREGAHRRRVDGWDDRADDGDRAPRARAHDDLDHVDDR